MNKLIDQVAMNSALALALASLFTAAPAQVRDAAPRGAQVHPTTQAREPGIRWAGVPTRTLSAGGVDFAYRELGQQHGGTPVVLLNHLAAVLDNWDPRVVDGIAARRHVIVFDNRGVGASTGTPSNSMEQMADDAIAFIKATGSTQVDLFGFSMGGMIAQEIVLKEPQLVRRMILAGTGPAGGEGRPKVTDLLDLTCAYDDRNMMTIMSTVPTRKELSHERIVDVAARAIRRAGYRGVGVADIMKEAGLTHGGFYAHFASRDALLVEAMQKASRDNQAALSEAMERRMAKGSTRFAALVWAYLHDSHLDRPDQGCVVAALASEMTRQDDAVREEARRRVTDLVALVGAALPPGTGPGQAAVVTATMVGALQLARTLDGKAGRALLAQTRAALVQRHDSPS